MSHRNYALAQLGCLGVLAAACVQDPPAPSPQATPSAAAALAPIPSARAPATKPPDASAATVSYEAEAEKVWSGSPSLLTGLTPTRFDDGRVAVGVWLAGRPQVLVFDRKGQGEVVRVPLKAALRNAPAKGTERHVLRVTPALGSGGAVLAYADYREQGSERRKVVCGPADSDQSLLQFDGVPLALPEEPEPSKDEAKPVEERRVRTMKRVGEPKKGEPAAEKEAAGPPALRKPGWQQERQQRRTQYLESRAKLAKQLRRDPSQGERELRDCRTIVDEGGVHAWAIGTELSVSPRKGKDPSYGIGLFIEREGGRGRVALHTVDLGTAPDRIDTFEAVTAAEMDPGRFVLAARYRGSLMVWMLGADKSQQGRLRTYGGGYPALPRFGHGKSPWLLTSTRDENGGSRLRYLEMGEQLPPTLTELELVPEHSSKSKPGFVALPRARLISYQFGDAKASGLALVAVDQSLRAAAPPIEIAGTAEAVSESLILPLGKDSAVVVYLRAPAGRAELVSRVVRIRSSG